MKPSKRIEMGSRVLGRGLAGICLLAVLSVAGPARADGNADSERANLLFKKGKVAFNDGKYTDALRIYTEAWHLKQSPDIAANLAQTEAELGKHRDAAEHFAFALAHLLPSSTDEQKNALAAGLEVEKKEIGTLHVTLEPADAAFSVDDAPVTLPTNGDVYVEPGDHRTSVTHEGYQVNQQALHVSKGGERVLWIKLEPAAGGAVAATSPAESGTNPGSELPRSSTNRPSMVDSEGSGGRSLVPAFVGGGIAIAGTAAGIGFLLSGSSHGNKADDLTSKISGRNGCGTGTPYAADCNSLHSENQSAASARRLETVSFAVAGAAAVATVLYLLWPHADGTSARVSGPVNFSALIPTFEVARGIGTAGHPAADGHRGPCHPDPLQEPATIQFISGLQHVGIPCEAGGWEDQRRG